MKTKLLKIQSTIIIASITLLGFSCKKEERGLCLYGTPTPEYGVPEVVFIDLGDVETIETEDNDSN
jgi:hypothetical protein